METVVRLARAAIVAGAFLLGGSGPAVPARATEDGVTATLPDQVVGVVNADRAAAGVAALSVDPRLTAVAQQRAQFLIDQSFFSHCTGGEADSRCSQSGFDMLPRLRQAGIQYDQAGTTVDENLALNNFPAAAPDSAAVQTTTAWLSSPEHQSNILDPRVTVTGVGIACCWVGTYSGNAIQAQDQASVIVEVFAGGPGVGAPDLAAPAPCTFVLGFATVASMIPRAVGQCSDNEGHNPANGDGLQHTSGGLLVWRKADNWTAFTDGYHTWVNGPRGLQERLNSQRFSWEANPDGLPVVS